jgi:diguanylate cyclase (GGDEF)-like protein
VNGLHGSQIARPESEHELLAKEWLLRLIDGTPLPAVGSLPVDWIVAEAPALIGGILDALADPSSATARALAPEERRRAEALSQLREGPRAAEQIPRDLAALQALLIECVRREIPEREAGDFAAAVERLAEVFGSIQGTVTRSRVEERSGAANDPLTSLPGPVQLEEWMRILLAEQRRYGHVFSLGLIDVDGLERINTAYGRDSGERILAAVAGVVKRQIRGVDQAFRLQEDELCVLAPHTDAAGLMPMANRMADLIEGSQASDGPRIAIAVGIVECPVDGDSTEALLRAAAEATFTAKAEGVSVSRYAAGPRGILQDP